MKEWCNRNQGAAEVSSHHSNTYKGICTFKVPCMRCLTVLKNGLLCSRLLTNLSKGFLAGVNSVQIGVLSKRVVMSLCCIRSDRRSFKLWWIIYKECTYFGMKKESGKQRESTFTNSVTILKTITVLGPRNSKNSKRIL